MRKKVLRASAGLLLAASVAGCAAAAAPCRVTGGAVKVVPLVGDLVGGALDTCGDVID